MLHPMNEERALAKMRWLRTRVHLSNIHDKGGRHDDWYRIYRATDKLDPAPEIVFNTAKWEYMRSLKFNEEATCCAMAHAYLNLELTHVAYR